ncbi:MAG: hypothetical protein AAF770_01685 [Bacteroidota bacterium]
MRYRAKNIKSFSFVGGLFVYLVGFWVTGQDVELDGNILIALFFSLVLIVLGQGEDITMRRTVTGIIISSFYFPLFLLGCSQFFQFTMRPREYYYLISWVFFFGTVASLINSGSSLITFSQALCFYFYKENQVECLIMLLKLDPSILEKVKKLQVREVSDFCMIVGLVWLIFFSLFNLFSYITGAWETRKKSTKG